MFDAVWGVVSTTLLIFTLSLAFVFVYRAGYGKGYKKGATQVLNEWKAFNKTYGVGRDDKDLP